MPKEIELKVLEVNVKQLHEKLMRLRAKKLGTFLVHERVYDYPDKKIKKRDELFRIRQYGNETQVTYKANSKRNTRFLEHDEYETHAGDFHTLCQIVELIGLKITKDREKRRTSYTLGKVKIEIDKYPTIPAYMEIEGTKKDIKWALKKLGYTMKDTTNMTSTKVLRHYRKNPDYQNF